MIQLYAYDTQGQSHQLDMYGDDPLLLTISAEDLTSVEKVDASYSKAFRIPATHNNSRFFKWWFDINTVDFDVTQKVKAEIHVNGLLYSIGQLRIQNAYINEHNVDLEIIYLGETKDFAIELGDGFLPEIETSDSNHILNTQNIEDSWLDFGDPSLLVDGKVRYILAQRGYDYDGNSAIIQSGEISLGDPESFTAVGKAISPSQMTPIIQVKYLIDKMFQETNYTYSPDSVFNNDWFQYLYTDGLPGATSEIQSVSADIEVRQLTRNIDNIVRTIPFEVKDSDPASAWYGDRWIAQIAGSPTFDLTLPYTVTVLFGFPVSISIDIRKNGVSVSNYTNSGISSITGSAILSPVVAVVPGDQISITANYTTSAPPFSASVFGGTLDVTNAGASIVTSQLLKSDVKKVEFLRSILTKFRLVMVPSKNVNKQFIIKPWVDYIGNGNAFDWTKKLDNSKDVTLQPVFYDQTATIQFTDKAGYDNVNIFNQDHYNRIYGELRFNSFNDLIVGENVIDTIFSPTPVAVIQGGTNNSDFIIPQFFKYGSEQAAQGGHFQMIPVRPNMRLLFWNGLRPLPISQEHWHMEGMDAMDYASYPLASYLSTFPATAQTLNLNWFKEGPYFDGISIDGTSGYSTYDAYWNSYTQSLYNPASRKMTAHFTLDAEDLREVTFDDAIFIQNSWWRVLKIYDAPLDDLASIKIDLAKLLNYPPLENSPVGGNWGIAIDGTSGTSGTSGNPPTNRYYRLSNCDGVSEDITAQYTSTNALALLKVVRVSGSGYIDTCWTVTNITVGPAATTITDIFDDCGSCES